MKKENCVGILGATGLIGLQLTALLMEHPGIRDVIPFSQRFGGAFLSHLFPAYRHLNHVRFQKPEPEFLEKCETLFMAMPHGESFPYVEMLKDRAMTILDLSSDFRFKDPARYECIYRRPHPMPGTQPGFSLVLPEINGNVLQNQPAKISLPGCTSTAIILALYPLLKNNLLSSSTIIVDAKTSSSGSGKNGSRAQMHYLRSQGVRVHKLMDQHRHRYEAIEFLKDHTGQAVDVFLNTFSVDLIRGISAACYVDLKAGVENRDLFSVYRDAYAQSCCIRILKLKTGFEQYPNPKLTTGTNFCDLGFHVDEKSGKGILIAVVDNLIKGGAGQAVQCYNRLKDWPEATALPLRPFFP